MRNCVFCGKPAGFLRHQHSECRKRHDRVVAMIPDFFAKVDKSSLPLDRFSQLLRNVADASFIKPDELQALATAGILEMLDKILVERLPTAAEELRFERMIDALGDILPDRRPLEERLVKISILRELADRRVPDRIIVDGPMPIEFRRGESIVWIFNDVKSYTHPPVTMTEEQANAALPKAGNKQDFSLPQPPDTYFGAKAFADNKMPRQKSSQEAKGDIVLTNHNVYFLFGDDLPRRIPVSRLIVVRAYASGVQIVWGMSTQRARTAIIDDPSFFVNVLVRLTRNIHKT